MKTFAQELEQIYDNYHHKRKMYSIHSFINSRPFIKNHDFVLNQLRSFLIQCELAANDGDFKREFYFNHSVYDKVRDVTESDLYAIRDYILEQGFILVDDHFSVYDISLGRENGNLIYSKSAHTIVQWATPLNFKEISS